MAGDSSEPTGVLKERLRKLSKAQLESRDVFGRALIHLVCLLGRFDLLESLLANPQCSATLTDRENLWTGLHYAIFYGRLSCARLLVHHNSDLVKVKDRNGLTAMDIYHLQYSQRNLRIWPQSIGKHDTNFVQRFPEDKCEDPLIWWDKDTRGGSDIFTMGVNVNYQLATGDADDRLKTPFKIEVPNFRLRNESLGIADRLVKPRIKEFAISKNHSVVLTNEPYNNVLVAGNASRGRLGTGNSIPQYKLTQLNYFEDEHIRSVVVSDDHSLVLTSNGHVYSWGLNNFYQLGYPTEIVRSKPDTFGDTPKRVVNGLKRIKVKGIACSKIHSCAYSERSLIVWGLNVGQMDIVSTGETVYHGKLKGIVQHPRVVEFPNVIKQVLATEEATFVLLESDECHILTHGNKIRFQIPLFKAFNDEFKFFRPTGLSRKRSIVKLVGKNSCHVAILYDDGSVSSFGVDEFSKSSNIKTSEVWTPRNSHLKCTDVDIGSDGSVIIVVKSGCCYKRVYRKNKIDFKFTKIERLSKIVKVFCDSLFTSFGFIKDDVDQLPLELFKNRFLIDIGHLSPLRACVSGRRRSELISPDTYESYTINFLNKPEYESLEDGSNDFQKAAEESNDGEQTPGDLLYKCYKDRWTMTQTIDNTFQQIDTEHLMHLSHCDMKLFSTCFDNDKGYDLFFDVGGDIFGVHKGLLFLIEKFGDIENEDLLIEDFRFQKVDKRSVIQVENLEPLTLLIMLNVLYTGEYLKPWEDSEEVSPLMKKVKHETRVLLENIRLTDSLNRLTYDIHTALSNHSLIVNDVSIKLRDNHTVYCWSTVLKARSAYFETLFSERWDSNTALEFTHIGKDVFDVVLDYIYGAEQLTLLDDKKYTVAADFINFCFEIIEVSDELLLFGLKDFAQLMIKDFIDSDNVLLILHHAELLDCQKLVGECLWFIYNNVDHHINDMNYGLLNKSTIIRIDKYCRWLQRVNKYVHADVQAHWYDRDSDELLKQFLDSRRDFNDIFLTYDDFVPLFDEPEKKVVVKSPKLAPKKTKEHVAVPEADCTPHRASSTSTPISTKSFADYLRKSAAMAQDSTAIEFVEDDFQPVINRRRKSSASRRSSSSSPSVSITTSSSRGNGTISTPSRIVGTSPKNIPIVKGGHSKQPGDSAWPNYSAVSSKSVGTPSSWSSPLSIPSSPCSNSAWLPLDTENGLSNSANTPKVNFSSKRLSQKERKKLMKQQEDKTITTPSKSHSPWNIPSASSSSSLTLSISEAREEALSTTTPSLKGIIHEEQHKVVEAKRTPVKSLVEIQQEEEFAQWWEEESRRVQEEMAQMNMNNNSHNGQADNKRKHKKRVNSNNNNNTRRYRKQSVP